MIARTQFRVCAHRSWRHALGIAAAFMLLGCNEGVPGPAGPVGPTGPPGPRGEPTDLRGKAVELPPDQPFTYAVVAAGQVRGFQVRPPVYNGLRVLASSASAGLVLTYNGYREPDQTRQLIVKAIASDVNEIGGPYHVHLIGFNEQGFGLRVTGKRGEIRDPSVASISVEVSELTPRN